MVRDRVVHNTHVATIATLPPKNCKSFGVRNIRLWPDPGRPGSAGAPAKRYNTARPECRHGVVASNTSAGAVAIAVTAATAQASLVEEESVSKRWKQQWKVSVKQVKLSRDL